MDHEEVRPDIVILGKALSGGLYPVSEQTMMIIELNTVKHRHTGWGAELKMGCINKKTIESEINNTISVCT